MRNTFMFVEFWTLEFRFLPAQNPKRHPLNDERLACFDQTLPSFLRISQNKQLKDAWLFCSRSQPN
jgi:hypothetical protein